ncbi:MAG TPA: acetyl-CoA carboxylase biotin carboxyl carrier protein subunit [Fimbriimonadaceae bacterium]|nr:acetyl-CoA carboxylase biotin carboxyl carrier protein subunit [Fimbriimonadaceae bacterium]
MSDLRQRIDDIAALMEEFRLSEAEFESEDGRIAFRRRSATVVVAAPHLVEQSALAEDHVFPVEPEPISSTPKGTPITSPMTGIYYSAPSPNAPPFVREGEMVTAGQVVGLIEAMKVFNEITAAVSGTVTKVLAESGQLVQPGDPLLYVA